MPEDPRILFPQEHVIPRGRSADGEICRRMMPVDGKRVGRHHVFGGVHPLTQNHTNWDVLRAVNLWGKYHDFMETWKLHTEVGN
jgi:hypothetical protein